MVWAGFGLEFRQGLRQRFGVGFGQMFVQEFVQGFSKDSGWDFCKGAG